MSGGRTECPMTKLRDCNNVDKNSGTISQAAVLFISHGAFLKVQNCLSDHLGLQHRFFFFRSIIHISDKVSDKVSETLVAKQICGLTLYHVFIQKRILTG